jgi:endonuclease/exonuclease/phosphatase family metal-dependent hydrolase
VVTVATYNTHFGHDRRGRPFDVIAAIAALDADVIALQEVWEWHGGTSFAARAAAALGYHVHETAISPGTVTHRQDLTDDLESSEGWWGIALLSRFPSRARPAIDLGRVPLDRARRVALPVEVDVPGEGTLLVAVTHISHRLFGSPRQMRRLYEAVPRHGQPTIVMGDFNMWGPVVERLFGRGWQRAVKGRTWPAWRPHSQIDHVMVNDHVEVVGGRVLDETGSDHRPILAELRLR